MNSFTVFKLKQNVVSVELLIALVDFIQVENSLKTWYDLWNVNPINLFKIASK